MTGLQTMVVLAVGVLGVFGLGAVAGAGYVAAIWLDSLDTPRGRGGRP